MLSICLEHEKPKHAEASTPQWRWKICRCDYTRPTIIKYILHVLSSHVLLRCIKRVRWEMETNHSWQVSSLSYLQCWRLATAVNSNLTNLISAPPRLGSTLCPSVSCTKKAIASPSPFRQRNKKGWKLREIGVLRSFVLNKIESAVIRLLEQ